MDVNSFGTLKRRTEYVETITPHRGSGADVLPVWNLKRGTV